MLHISRQIKSIIWYNVLIRINCEGIENVCGKNARNTLAYRDSQSYIREKKRKGIFDKKSRKKDKVNLPEPEPRLLIGALYVMDLDSGEILDFEIVKSEDINIDENKIKSKGAHCN